MSSRLCLLCPANRRLASRIRDVLGLVVKCDRTVGRTIQSSLLTWASVGAVGTDGMTVRLDRNEKDCVTVLVSVTGDCEKRR
jgi:hypothetical protein